AMAAGLIATVAGEIAHNDFVVIAGSGAITALIVGLLLYRMRPAIAMLRTAAAGPEATAEAATGAEQPAEDELTAELAAMWGLIAPGSRGPLRSPMGSHRRGSSAGSRRPCPYTGIFRGSCPAAWM